MEHTSLHLSVYIKKMAWFKQIAKESAPGEENTPEPHVITGKRKNRKHIYKQRM